MILPNGGKHEEEIEYVHDYSWRNFFATINYAKIMQKLSKGRPHRIWMLVHYKSSVCLTCEDWFQMRIHSFRKAVLKRVLRVMHPMLQLNILKLIKSQVPYCGRRWRQCTNSVVFLVYEAYHLFLILANMKVITAIYLNCRPDLRDEWLTGNEVEEGQGAQVSGQEICVEMLTEFTGPRTSTA